MRPSPTETTPPATRTRNGDSGSPLLAAGAVASPTNVAAEPQRWWSLSRRDQCLVFAGLAAGALLLAYQWTHAGDRIDFETQPLVVLDFKLDINGADWPELCLLPGVGESLAQSIVEDRQRRGPFASHEDLLRVRKLGPKTLAAIRPYLLPLEESQGPNAAEVGGASPPNLVD
ncbi:DNA uptake protein-like protein DNA-binding protein [Pirellula staleyi DSM 6068]|uniref:DNA uptake protein-like protein DNA-binding protein n=1 Tax=Pirellula staleyi (strain ATCC 27377 / DSM 6068 / ICPB 4128) TaxID=530564 RepID=D2R4V8_PIRSD|nr:helix-hairpin-helix domain-containing protein [Pirellula staleyi]ADB18920.1 DNA uptake protein-like protein DNA-binding protein [Pirellula staleyi DSM 6068]